MASLPNPVTVPAVFALYEVLSSEYEPVKVAADTVTTPEVSSLMELSEDAASEVSLKVTASFLIHLLFQLCQPHKQCLHQ